MIEELRYLLKSDPALYIGQVISVSALDSDKSEYLVRMKLLPDNGEVVAEQAFDDQKLQLNDLALVVMPDNQPEYARVLHFMPSVSNPIHARTDAGHRVLKSRAGKKTHIVSDTKVTIGKGGSTEEAEPLVLGAVLTSCLTDLVTNIGTLITHSNTIATQLSALATIVAGVPSGGGASAVTTAVAPVISALPTLKTLIDTTDKDKYLSTSSTNIKSQIGFTERGS